MEYLRCVRYRKNCYIGFKEIETRHINYIYIPLEEPDETVEEFIAHYQGYKIYWDYDIFEEKRTSILTIVKEYFNPLLKQQNILFISNNNEVLYELPYVYMKLCCEKESMCHVNQMIDRLSDQNKREILINILSFSITKDIMFLNRLVVGKFDLSLFVLSERFFCDIKNIEIADEMINILNQYKHNCIENDLRRKLYELKESQRIEINKLSEGKNLILIHLESISNLIFSSNKHLMPNLSVLAEQSLNFTRFYSSATSTIMSVCAILYGNDFEADSFKEYNDFQIEDSYNENLFKILHNVGYKTQAIAAYDKELVHTMRDTGIWSDGATKYEPDYSHREFIDHLESFLDNNKNSKFAIFVDNKYTHCGIGDEINNSTSTFEKKMELSYISLNETIKTIYKRLEDNQLLEKTLIVAYGDHGDDKWTRAINYGFSHSTEPYGSIINTPLFIFDSNIQAGISTELISSIDVKSMILFLLNIKNPDKFPFSGRNIFIEKNDVVYSQSLFYNQKEVEIIKSLYSVKLNQFCKEEIKKKAFAVLNESFCLIVSNRGVEFFNTISDPLCYNNLFRFYEFDEKGNAQFFKNYNAWRGHFRIEVMKDAQIYHCLKNFYELREKLIKRLQAKSYFIKELNGDSFDISNFNKIRRGYLDE